GISGKGRELKRVCRIDWIRGLGTEGIFHAQAESIALPPACGLKICHRKPWQNEGFYIDASLRRIAGRPPRSIGALAGSDLQRGIEQLEERPLYTSGSSSSVKSAQRRPFSQPDLHETTG